MAITFKTERALKFLIPAYPSTGSAGYAGKGDLVYKSSDLYVSATSSITGSTNGAILGIVETVSTSTATLGYIAPVTGELLEIDFSTDWSTTVVSTTNIARLFRVSLSTTYGTVLDLSTAPVTNASYGSTVDAIASSDNAIFYVTAFSTDRHKAVGFIPGRFNYV